MCKQKHDRPAEEDILKPYFGLSMQQVENLNIRLGKESPSLDSRHIVKQAEEDILNLIEHIASQNLHPRARKESPVWTSRNMVKQAGEDVLNLSEHIAGTESAFKSEEKITSLENQNHGITS